MSDKDAPKTNERDDEDRDSDADVESERTPEPAPKKVAAKKGGKRREHAAKAAPASSGSSVGVFVLLALLAGGGAGWFGHMQQAKAASKSADGAAAPAGSAGPCAAWEKKLCKSAGEESAACMQAKSAGELLTPAVCDVALTTLPATLTKLKAARASCDKLVSKLCKDLPPGSQMCSMVKEKTPAFPAQRCDEMLEHYEEVLGQLKQMEEQQGGMMRGPGGPGGPGMAPPPGVSAPPGDDGHGH